jgi:HK97 gp10 family phage protein
MIIFVRLAGGAAKLAGRAAAGLGRAGLRGAQALGRRLVQEVGKRAQGDAGGLDVGGGLPGFGGGDGLSAAVRGAAASTVAKAALEMQAEARRLAPVKTGRLRDSIRARQLGPLSWVVEVGVDYGGYVEYGTSRAPARPYMRPAFEKTAAGFRDMAIADFNRAVDRIAR